MYFMQKADVADPGAIFMVEITGPPPNGGSTSSVPLLGRLATGINMSLVHLLQVLLIVYAWHMTCH